MVCVRWCACSDPNPETPGDEDVDVENCPKIASIKAHPAYSKYAALGLEAIEVQCAFNPHMGGLLEFVIFAVEVLRVFVMKWVVVGDSCKLAYFHVQFWV